MLQRWFIFSLILVSRFCQPHTLYTVVIFMLVSFSLLLLNLRSVFGICLHDHWDCSCWHFAVSCSDDLATSELCQLSFVLKTAMSNCIFPHCFNSWRMLLIHPNSCIKVQILIHWVFASTAYSTPSFKAGSVRPKYLRL